MDLQEAAMEARNGHRIPPTEEKVIIDTDPGIGTLILISPLLLPASVTVIHPSILTITNSYQFPDDSVAIMMAFEAPGVKVVGLTTIFGNCTTSHATRNALILASLFSFLSFTMPPLPRLTCFIKLMRLLN
jgi:uridine nucleosidase